MHKLNVVWNNSFKLTFGGFWRERVKSLQFCTNSLSATFGTETLFWRKMFLRSNIILRAISCLVRCRSVNVGHQYGVDSVCSVSKDNVMHAV